MSTENESLFDLFIFETTQNIEQLEQLILNHNEEEAYTAEMVAEIFRVMHTIKGSAAMMQFDLVSRFAHKLESLFSILRDDPEAGYDAAELSDLVLSGIDFIKEELNKLTEGKQSDGDASEITKTIEDFTARLKGETGKSKDSEAPASEIKLQAAQDGPSGRFHYHAEFFFEEGCMMENIRAFDIVHKLESFARDISYTPDNIFDSDSSAEIIQKNGFVINFSSDTVYDEVQQFFKKQIFLKNLRLDEIKEPEVKTAVRQNGDAAKKCAQGKETSATAAGGIISVNVGKLDKMLDLMGELVLAEAMVIHNPEIKKLEIDSFQKAAGQLRKITREMQELVMSVRMVPLTATFQRMNRIVRDMNKKLGKNVELKTYGGDTEVDKNIIDHISDPLMHLVRNSLDHGIESPEERAAAGKPEKGAVVIEAKNEGGHVLVIVRDDGKGLDRDKILKRGQERGVLTKPAEEMTDREIYSLIFRPGFSTKEKVTEFSGRGVGLDVVVKNIEEVGGSVSVDCVRGKGSVFIMKFPLTLAIIDGMNIRVGSSVYTLPIANAREFFRPDPKQAFLDPDGNEMIMIRKNCYPVIRLNRLFGISSDTDDLCHGTLIMAESGDKAVCLFADELLGQQEVVVKAMPRYLRKIKGLSGCTLLGDGRISLILDVTGILSCR